MRTIEQNMVHAFNARKNWKSGNTEVRVSTEGGATTVVVLLHGNEIFEESHNLQGLFVRYFTLHGWDTPTTRSRLRALGLEVYRSKGVTMYKGDEIGKNGWYMV